MLCQHRKGFLHMKIVAVIAEYNPFHNGHLFQLDTIRQTIGADYIIVVLSGDFVQRGEPAIVDKYARCRMALSCGADAVFELPVYFALGSAEYFAKGAVTLLDRLGVTDVLHFGSECGEIGLLYQYAQLITEETDEYRHLLNFHLKKGKSFPLARSKAVEALSVSPDIFSSPNNILGMEYIKALLQLKSPITPLTLQRAGAGFSSGTLSEGELPSANAIRKCLWENPNSAFSCLKGFMPDACLALLQQNTLLFQNDFSQILIYRLLQNTGFGKKFAHFYDVSPELSNTISANAMRFLSFEAFAHLCKSRNLTYTRICRSLMHILLDMTQENADLLKTDGYCNYARLLGFRTKNNKSGLLSQIKKSADIPIITSPSKGIRQLTGSALMSLKADIHAANVYESIKAQKMTNMSPLNELTREIIKLPQ